MGPRAVPQGSALDRWIISEQQGLTSFVHEELAAYRLYTIVPRLVAFLGDLTNWYVRLSRDRMRGAHGSDEAFTALCTLYDVLLSTSILMAPVTPFLTELMYQTLARALPYGHVLKAESVHFVMIPKARDDAVDAGTVLKRWVSEMHGL